MKKFFVFMSIAAFLVLFLVSCGDDKKTIKTDEDVAENVDEIVNDVDEMTDETVVDEEEVADVVDEEEALDEDIIDPCAEMECPENSTCVPDGEDATCECNEGFHPTNGECISDTEMTEIGEFTMAFKGPVNQTSNPSEISPGTGDAEFTYFDEDFTFTVLHIDSEQLKIDFPFAAVAEGGMVTATWIDAVSFSPKFFAINVPDNLTVGNDIDFVETQTYALYGDLTYDGTNVGIKCIRAVSGEATLDLTELTATDIELTAAGKLIDPAYAIEQGYNLPEICED
ncbi:MAG TPA: EB domain-containing protein [bacterium]|nr:EB domain-containing protein [bacterium]